MDGAHNEDAAKKLAASIETYFPGKKLFYIMGVFKDKEYEKVIRITAPYAARVTAVETPGNPRVLEIKQTKNRGDLETLCDEALKQIKSKRYSDKIKNDGYRVY